MKPLNLVLFLLIAIAVQSQAQGSSTNKYRILKENRVYQWEANLEVIAPVNENNPRQAYLWIPPGCKQLKGIIFCGHNHIEEGILEDPLFRQALNELDFGEIWVTPGITSNYGNYDLKLGAQETFIEIINKLSEVSGYDEIRHAPIVYLSHSSQASQPWNFGAYNPERTLAMISFHGDSPRSTYLCCNLQNPNWQDRDIDGIPGLICIGELEWNEFRIEDSFRFMKQYPNSLISLLCNAGRGHSDFSQDDLKYLIAFIKKSAKYRMPKSWDGQSLMPLKKLKRKEGWLADRWHKNSPPSDRTESYNAYNGNKDSAYWYFDEEMARWTESIYTRERGKKKQYLGLMQNGKFLKRGELLEFMTDGKNMDIHAKVVFTDSSHTHFSDNHSIEPIWIKRCAGPVEIVNDTTFRFSFYRPGTLHKRVTEIGLFAFSESDYFYGHGVCDISWRMPLTLTEGKPQEIKFPDIPDVKEGTRFLQLKATTDRKLPVQYYVQSGPAYVEGDILIFAGLPPKTKYPVRITVVAWQYGSMVEPKIQTAKTVKKTFYLYK